MAGGEWIDDLGRALARGATRKEFLRIVAAAIVGTFFPTGVATHRAVATERSGQNKPQLKPKGPKCADDLDCVHAPYDSLTCCAGTCCTSGMDCAHGQSKEYCCPLDRICSRGVFDDCCKSSAENCTILDGCCPPGQQTCGHQSGSATPDQCCRKGEVCIGSGQNEACCPSKQACGDTCCKSNETCAGGQCCPKARACGQFCCGAGTQCKNGQCVCDTKACKKQNGCCDPQTGVCVTGASDLFCGKGGNVCTDCQALGLVCDAVSRTCVCPDGNPPVNGTCGGQCLARGVACGNGCFCVETTESTLVCAGLVACDVAASCASSGDCGGNGFVCGDQVCLGNRNACVPTNGCFGGGGGGGGGGAAPKRQTAPR